MTPEIQTVSKKSPYLIKTVSNSLCSLHRPPQTLPHVPASGSAQSPGAMHTLPSPALAVHCMLCKTHGHRMCGAPRARMRLGHTLHGPVHKPMSPLSCSRPPCTPASAPFLVFSPRFHSSGPNQSIFLNYYSIHFRVIYDWVLLC